MEGGMDECAVGWLYPQANRSNSDKRNSLEKVTNIGIGWTGYGQIPDKMWESRYRPSARAGRWRVSASELRSLDGRSVDEMGGWVRLSWKCVRE